MGNRRSTTNDTPGTNGALAQDSSFAFSQYDRSDIGAYPQVLRFTVEPFVIELERATIEFLFEQLELFDGTIDLHAEPPATTPIARSSLFVMKLRIGRGDTKNILEPWVFVEMEDGEKITNIKSRRSKVRVGDNGRRPREVHAHRGNMISTVPFHAVNIGDVHDHGLKTNLCSLQIP